MSMISEIMDDVDAAIINDIVTPTVRRFYKKVTYNGGNELVVVHKHYFVDKKDRARCSLCYRYVKPKQLYCKVCWRKVMKEDENNIT